MQRDNLSDAGLTVDWLVSELAKLGIDDVNEVFFASLDTQGNLFYQTRKER
ncbi:MAG: YetF domain-containing protein [Limnochordia bacterium]